MSTLSSGTTLTTAIKFTSDTTGSIVFQSNGTTEAMRIDTSQNVGIGDSAPSSLGKLVIAGATQKAYFSTNSTYGAPALLSLATQDLYLNPTQQSDRRVGIGGNGYAFSAMLMVRPASGQAPFSVENSAASASYFYINSTGNVGIGTTSPATRLQIGNYGSTEELTLAMSANAEGRINFYDTNNTEGAVIRVVGGGAGAKMHFTNRYDTDSDKVTFDLVNGRVGIGTTSPSTILQVSAAIPVVTVTSTGITASSQDFTTNSAAQRASIGVEQSTGGGLFVGSSAYAAVFGSAGASSCQLASNNNVRLTIDSAGLVGIGTTSPYSNLQVTGTIKVATGNAQGIIGLGEGNGATINVGIYRGAAVAPTTDGNYLNLGGYDGIVFATGNAAIASQTERMRIDSLGNLGFGAAPSISSSGRPLVEFNSTLAAYVCNNNTGSLNLQQNSYYNGNNYAKVAAAGTAYHLYNGTHNFYRMASVAAGAAQTFTSSMYIDDSGNVGIGVTPNSWTSGWTALQFGSYGNLSALSNQINLSSNIYYSGSSWYYKNTNPATNFYQQNGGFGWQSAASGTAGTSPSLTTYMWLSAAGNLGIGTTSPGFKTEVIAPYGTYNTTVTTQSDIGGGIAITASSSGASSRVGLFFRGSDNIGAAIASAREDTGASWNTYLAFYTNNSTGVSTTAVQEKMRLTSGGTLNLPYGQIEFPATQVPSSGPNTLDDYEEGTWTPTFKASGGTAPSTQTGTGYYVKIGRMVHVQGQISWSGSGSGGSNLYVDLPFTVLSTGRGGLAIGLLSGLTWLDGSQLSLLPELNSSVAYFTYKVPSGAAHVHLTYSAIADIGSHLVTFGGSYSTND